MFNLDNKKIIAWGASKLLELYLKNADHATVTYIVDSNPDANSVHGIPAHTPEILKTENKDEVLVIIFAVSNISIQNILKHLNTYGFLLNQNALLYSDLFYDSFQRKLEEILQKKPDKNNYLFAKSFSLSTHMPIHTTLHGNWLFLELLTDILNKNENDIAIAEIGAFQGGNALLSLVFMTQHKRMPFYILDSFDGFPKISIHDPQDKKRGDYNIECSFENILDTFSIFENAHVIKGIVPEAFSQLNDDTAYGLVLYDCDLYEPAIATFDYFWDKIISGGFLLIHDYCTEEGGFEGVKKATDEYFKSKNVQIHAFWENTMAMIIK